MTSRLTVVVWFDEMFGEIFTTKATNVNPEIRGFRDRSWC